MSNMRCIAMGISDAPPLEYLHGAENGAKAFGAWAKSLGIQTEILTDENKAVEVDAVKTAFARLFEGKPKVSRFLIYFAGHGLARDAAEDLWLLSSWFSDLRAVAVGGLCHRLARFGVEQLTVISDACRSPAADQWSADLVADPVLDKGPFDLHVPLVDMFRASSPFHAAYMVTGSKPEEDRCIFSGLLDEAICGAQDSAFEAPDRIRVSNFSLAAFLTEQVPLRAAQYKVELRPDIATGLRPPDNVYLASRPATPPVVVPWPLAAAIGPMSADPGSSTPHRGWSTATKELAEYWLSTDGGPGDAPLKPLFERDTHRLTIVRRAKRADVRRYLRGYASESLRPENLDTGAGFNVAGAEAVQAVTGRSATARRYPTHSYALSWWMVGTAELDQLKAATPVLFETHKGTWGGAAVLPGQIATFTIEEESVVSLIYRLVGTSAEEYRETERAVAQMRADMMTTEARYDLAARLRTGSGRDPMRAVIAAYLYDSMGDVDSVRRLSYCLASVGMPIPYDVALLGRLKSWRSTDGRVAVDVAETSERKPRSSKEAGRASTFMGTPLMPDMPVAGAFPWLRQGWSLLEDESPSELIIDGLTELQGELKASPFLTLTAKGGEDLKTMIEEA